MTARTIAAVPQVYRATTEGIISKVMGGFNGTVFAYGQTSSGKTHTMLGAAHEPGIVPLAVRAIFDHIEATQDREFLLRVSYMEVRDCNLTIPYNFTDANSCCCDRHTPLGASMPSQASQWVHCSRCFHVMLSDVCLWASSAGRIATGANEKCQAVKAEQLDKMCRMAVQTAPGFCRGGPA